MTTAAGEYAPLALPSQFAALAIAADPPELHSHFALPSPPSSSSSSPQEDFPEEAANAGGGAAAAAAPTRKAWGSPPRRGPDQGEVAFMEELGSSWPVPSRGGASTRKRHPQQNPQEGPLGTPLAAATAAAAMAPSESPQESASGGDPIARSAATSLPVDPPQKQQKGKEEGAAWGTEMRTKANNNPKSPRPPLRPRQQQARPPMQNGHRGRNQQHFLGNGGNYQQQRPRHQRKAGFFPLHQPAQLISDYGYQSAMMGLLNPSPDWGINPSSSLQWGPNLQTTPPRMNTPAPPENLFHHPGYFPGPFSPDGISYCAAPFAPMLRPPLGQNPPWFMAPLHPLAEPTLPHHPANPPLPPNVHQLPPGVQEAEDVASRLRKQIEYYFSDQNLIKDVYLRTCMDEEGWISVHTIANFPRVQRLTRDVGLIVAALQTSPTVEVSVDKMRRKGEWGRWIIQRQPPSGCEPRRAPEG